MCILQRQGHHLRGKGGEEEPHRYAWLQHNVGVSSVYAIPLVIDLGVSESVLAHGSVAPYRVGTAQYGQDAR